MTEVRNGRKFVCGDIHGAKDKLFEALDRIGFDYGNDTLYALGDLVDRGPDSYGVLKLLEEPWFESIKGNHELMMEQAHDGADRYEMHKHNGGGWFEFLSADERDHCVSLTRDLPIAMTVDTPSGRRVGLVHAELPGACWNEFEAMLQSENLSHAEAAGASALWGRTKVKQAQRKAPVANVANIDMVYMGHTPLDKPLQCGNLRWIDTGACWDDGYLTIEELV